MKTCWLLELFGCFLRSYCSSFNVCMLKVCGLIFVCLFLNRVFKNFLYRCHIIRNAVLPVEFEKKILKEAPEQGILLKKITLFLGQINVF